QDAVGLPVPHHEAVGGRVHRQADVPAVPVDVRVAEIDVGVGLERGRGRLVAHDGGAGEAAHPDEEAVVHALVKPDRARLGGDGPPAAGRLRHGPGTHAADGAAVAGVGVV